MTICCPFHIDGGDPTLPCHEICEALEREDEDEDPFGDDDPYGAPLDDGFGDQD
jgi:hypothetical protein